MTSESLSDEHKRLGLAVTKLISEHAGRLESAPVASAATPADLKLLFDEPLPIAGMPAEEILTQFERDVAPHAMQVPSPRYFGQFNPTPLAFGVLASGGSEANLIALKCARDSADGTIRSQGMRPARGDLVVYASEQCHFSLEKSVDILGMGRQCLRKIDTDERFHIRVDLLRAQIAKDLSHGRVPCCIVGMAGATSTG